MTHQQYKVIVKYISWIVPSTKNGRVTYHQPYRTKSSNNSPEYSVYVNMNNTDGNPISWQVGMLPLHRKHFYEAFKVS